MLSEALLKIKLPTTKEEDWKYTNLKSLGEKQFKVPGKVSSKDLLGNLTIKNYLGHLQISPWLIVFADGRFAKDLSRLPEDKKLVISTLDAAVKKSDALKKQLKAKTSKPFVRLNQTLAHQGVYICAKEKMQLDDPIVILHLSSQSDVASHYTHVIQAGKDARLEVVEIYKGFETGYFNNSVTHIDLESSSELIYSKSQEENTKSFHIHTVEARLSKNSRLQSHLMSLGGLLSRNEMDVRLEAPHGRCQLNGLFAGSEKQHVDNNTTIHHEVERCESEELYKGILDGASHGVFSGKVIVSQNAQKTDAKQSNKNLLLSDDAQIDSKPQLMIYADDVKCSHGATIGQLDKQQMFYLQSRGIEAEDARQMLIKAFAAEMMDKIKNAKVKDYYDKAVHSWFNNQVLH